MHLVEGDPGPTLLYLNLPISTRFYPNSSIPRCNFFSSELCTGYSPPINTVKHYYNLKAHTTVALPGGCVLECGVRTSDFDYALPPELIAQVPAERRDSSRLLAVNRRNLTLSHHVFSDIFRFFRPGDLLVSNNSRVIPARLRGRNVASGGQFELLLLEEMGVNDWWVMLKPGRRARVGTKIQLLERSGKPVGVYAEVSETNAEGHRRLQFSGTSNIIDDLAQLGETPLPPYIKRERNAEMAEDIERYQTVYAQVAGSVAAPTAGLHFTRELLEKIRLAGVGVTNVTLHVGLGTFAPVKAERVSEHTMHEERFEISPATAEAIRRTKKEGGRVIAVGTTTVRVLESVAAKEGGLQPGAGRTNIFIYPPRDFAIVDGLVTNFHLPCSTLLMLVSAFAAPGKTSGRELVLKAYEEAIRERYRFFSYGDAMLIL